MTYDFRSPSNDRRSATAIPTDYAEAKARKAELDAEHERTGRALKELSGGGPMGLTPAEVRATLEWKAAKRDYDVAFAALRNFNEIYLRRFKREVAQDRRR